MHDGIQKYVEDIIECDKFGLNKEIEQTKILGTYKKSMKKKFNCKAETKNWGERKKERKKERKRERERERERERKVNVAKYKNKITKKQET